MTKGELLRYYRQKLGLRVTDIISRCKNITIDKYIYYEEGKGEINEEDLVEIATALGVSPEDFIASVTTKNKEKSVEELSHKVDWTEVWSERYPILKKYKDLDGIGLYIEKMEEIVEDFTIDYETTGEDTMLALKDILYCIYKQKKRD